MDLCTNVSTGLPNVLSLTRFIELMGSWPVNGPFGNPLPKKYSCTSVLLTPHDHI
jgi:hypothetical protein